MPGQKFSISTDAASVIFSRMSCTPLDFFFFNIVPCTPIHFHYRLARRPSSEISANAQLLFAEIRLVESDSFLVMFLCDRFLLDIPLLIEREVYSKGNQNKAEKYTKLMNKAHESLFKFAVYNSFCLSDCGSPGN